MNGDPLAKVNFKEQFLPTPWKAAHFCILIVDKELLQ
jgi:hypothetical protein